MAKKPIIPLSELSGGIFPTLIDLPDAYNAGVGKSSPRMLFWKTAYKNCFSMQ